MEPEQANSLVLRPFILIAILLASTAATALPVSAQVYSPGVREGDSLFYGEVYSDVPLILAPLLPPEIRSLLGTTSITANVTSVTGTNVTLSQQLANQTGVRNITLRGDLRTGLGNLTYWIIAGGLKQNDPITEAADAPIINITLTKPYAGAIRIVNFLSTTQPLEGYPTIVVQLLAYWDQDSGALLEFTIHGYGTYGIFPISASAHVKVTETNIWQAQPDFTITTNPSSVTLEAGTSTSSDVTLTSVGGYSNTLTVISTVSHVGLQVKPTSKQLSLGPGGVQSFVLSINTTGSTPSGSYTVTVEAIDNNNLSHNTSVAVAVSPAPPGPDFQVAFGIENLAVEVGSTGSAAIQLNPLNGFTGFITLSSTSTPSGPVLTIQPVVVSLPATSGYASSTLQVSLPESVAPGSYVLTINAVSNGKFHAASLTLNATAPTQPSQETSQTTQTFFGLSLPVLVAIASAASVLLVSAIVYVGLRRTRSRPKPDSSPVL